MTMDKETYRFFHNTRQNRMASRVTSGYVRAEDGRPISTGLGKEEDANDVMGRLNLYWRQIPSGPLVR